MMVNSTPSLSRIGEQWRHYSKEHKNTPVICTLQMHGQTDPDHPIAFLADFGQIVPGKLGCAPCPSHVHKAISSNVNLTLTPVRAFPFPCTSVSLPDHPWAISLNQILDICGDVALFLKLAFSALLSSIHIVDKDCGKALRSIKSPVSPL